MCHCPWYCYFIVNILTVFFSKISIKALILFQNNDWSHMELALLQNHFQSGIGSYYHLLFKFQAEMKFNKPELFDFYLLINDDTVNNIKKDHFTLLKKNDTGKLKQ